MKTLVLKGNRAKDIKIAANLIEHGRLVAFPTETVYGLGADALNPKAIKKIFKAKKRPFNDPLIVHIADFASALDLTELRNDVQELSKAQKAKHALFLKLAEKFWPGPLTIVVKKSKLVPSIVTAEKNTVALRMPDNRIALELIIAANTPIAAPSANLFSRPSPTSADHVLEDLSGRIDAVLDGGQTKVGLESTILDLSGKKPRILRPGKISAKQLAPLLKKTAASSRFSEFPGGLKKHYSPKAKVVLVSKHNYSKAVKKALLSKNFFGILASQNEINLAKKSLPNKLKPKPLTAVLSANTFYRSLRNFDQKQVKTIIAFAPSPKGLGIALLDRLKKAAGI